ncbi:A/G-specific adenine glycosylase [Lutibacter holmesii]|uniref:Adenine DNA glycosylase n=1 Tax=Lutibacter holmesii TaxID=1137985 RepID=A0ABW3WLH4_9FLAO
MKFSNTLVQWYLQNKRDLPWRQTSNPYYIWLSEIILQQTRVDQGMAYYFKFVEHFPTVFELASASEEQVLKLWQGLGYYSRARNLHFSAKYIVTTLEGKFPTTYNSILKLKGVGDYTASAVASICFNEPTAVVDGNVYRVLARYFGIESAINSTKGIKQFKQLAQELIDVKIPGTHNQAVMEFGARMCKPQNPDCEICPLNSSCASLATNKVKELPFKEKKIKIRNRYFNYLVVHTANDTTKLVKREKGIWLNLYEFPLIETSSIIDETELVAHQNFKKLFHSLNVSVQLFNTKVMVHKLSHQHIYTNFWIVKTENSNQFNIDWNSVQDFPVSTLVNNFLKQYRSN